MRVSSWSEYALIISLHLAERRRARQGPQSARALAAAERLPLDFTEQILLQLRRARLVQSARGARGGYLLARDPDGVTVREILEAADRPVFEVKCDTHPVDAERCHPAAPCAIRPVWRELQRRVEAFLDGVTLADLMGDRAPQAQPVEELA